MSRREYDDPDRKIYDALEGDVERAPDMSADILGRLGMVEVSTSTARRRRLARCGSRLAMCAVAFVLVGLGIRAHSLSDDARRPEGMTLPSALENDLRRPRSDFNTFKRFIRPIGPREVPADTAPQTDDWAAAPVRNI